MTIYADKHFYEATYLGGKEAVITTAFEYYARQASQIIKQHTYGNVSEDNVSECVKMCCCELAELIFRDESFQAQSSGVSSESVQGWSKSFESTEARKIALHNAQMECIRKWLSGTGFLYCGVREC